jgi:hypothetical protein
MASLLYEGYHMASLLSDGSHMNTVEPAIAATCIQQPPLFEYDLN